jgi:uncharacterized membrane protein
MAEGRTAASDTPGRRRTDALERSLREFAAVPLLVIGLLLLLALVSIVSDQSHMPAMVSARKAMTHLIGRQASSATLSAVATGLVTVTSITFSVLLLAVQQTSASLSPVVFDQFVRRRSNQVFLGFFVGLALYAYVVMVAVQDGTPPILGAALATLLTVCALAFLLVLVYTTVDQMRPASVLRMIHDRALVARTREAELLRRTRREEQSRHPVSATYRCQTTGYVTGINLDRLAEALDQVPNAEIRLHIRVGDDLAYGDVIATVRDDDEADARWVADEVRSAVLIGTEPDPDYDAGTGIDELGNIAWTSGSTAKHNPEIARQALHALRDLAARWMLEEPGAEEDEEPLAIVYEDRDLDKLLTAMYSVLVAAHESQQHMGAARVLYAYRTLLPYAHGPVAERLHRDIRAAGPLLDDMPSSPTLDRARSELGEMVGSARRPGDGFDGEPSRDPSGNQPIRPGRR